MFGFHWLTNANETYAVLLTELGGVQGFSLDDDGKNWRHIPTEIEAHLQNAVMEMVDQLVDGRQEVVKESYAAWKDKTALEVMKGRVEAEGASRDVMNALKDKELLDRIRAEFEFDEVEEVRGRFLPFDSDEDVSRAVVSELTVYSGDKKVTFIQRGLSDPGTTEAYAGPWEKHGRVIDLPKPQKKVSEVSKEEETYGEMIARLEQNGASDEIIALLDNELKELILKHQKPDEIIEIKRAPTGRTHSFPLKKVILALTVVMEDGSITYELDELVEKVFGEDAGAHWRKGSVEFTIRASSEKSDESYDEMLVRLSEEGGDPGTFGYGSK